MRHSAAGPATKDKVATDSGKGAPAGFAKGPDGKWIKSSEESGFARTGSAVAPGSAAVKASNVQHFAPVDATKKTTTKAAPAADFAGAGSKEGLEVWRIEKLKPVAVPREQYGKFHSGDSYIVMNTYTPPNTSGRRYDLHFWLGESTSQDEAGVAAYKTVELDDKLGGIPVQHREVQGHESGLFLSYFKGGVEYLEGGMESGFRKVEHGVYKKRLLHLKGKRNIRVKEVPLAAASLNNGDVFVLDAGLTLYQFNGSEASRMEKAKGLEVTANINSNERGAKATVHILEYPGDASKEEFKQFWTELGGEGPVADAKAGGDDAEDERASAAGSQLFRVSDASGTLEVTPVEGKPLKQQQLDSNDYFIVDVGAQVFVWVGKGSTQEEKNSSMQFATHYLKSTGKPDYTPITRVVQGGESPIFKAQFSNWSDVSAPSSRPGKLEKKPAAGQAKVDVGSLHTSTRAIDTGRVIVHKGTGETKVWRVEDFKLAEQPKEQFGRFYAGDSYVILYSEKRDGGQDLHYIYFWQGRTSSTDEKGASALLAKEIDDSLGGRGIQIRVVQYKEPDHFLSLFKGNMIVKQGGHPSGFKTLAEDTTPSSESPVQLYHIKGTSSATTRAIEVPVAAASLNSGDAFVVLTTDAAYVWYGKGSSATERQVALNTAKKLTEGRNLKVQEVTEGSENDAFWNLLGGKTEYASDVSLYTEPKEPRLFWGSNASGVFKVEEIFGFSQDDLAEDDVYILDTFNEVYVWVGSGSNDVEKKAALETALVYVANAPDGRSKDTPVYRINAGSEPPLFTAHFLAWDASGGDVYTRKMRQLQLASSGSGKASAKDELQGMTAKSSYTFAELTANPKPKGIDVGSLEKYLVDDEFVKVLGVNRAAFDALPAWKKTELKKQKKLF